MNHFIPGSLKIYKRLFTVMGVIAALVGLLVSSADASQSSSFITKVGLGWFTASGQAGDTLQTLTNPEPLANPDQIGFELELAATINNARIARRLPPLKLNSQLRRSARAYGKELERSQLFSVIDSNRANPLQRAADAGYADAQVVLETIGAGYQNDSQFAAALFKNPLTSAQLMSADVTEIGIGYWFSLTDATYHHYWVVDLGRRSGTAFTLVANDDSLATTSSDVTLYIGGDGWAQRMQVSNLPNFNGATWESYTPTKSWTLSNGSGRRKVYVKLEHADGTQAQISTSIAVVPPQKGVTPGTLDDDTFYPPDRSVSAAPPASGTATPTPTLGGGASFTKTPRPTTTRTPAPAPGLGYAPGYYDTSGFMVGQVAVGIVMPQCTGAIDACTESWNSNRMDQVYNQIVAAMNWWNARTNGRVTFVFDQRRQVQTGYEPIRHPQSDEGLWMTDVMTKMGYSGASYFDQVYAYNNYLRQTYNADWAVTIFAVDSFNNSAGTFADGYFAYSYVQGPLLVVTFDNDGYSINNMGAVVAHETGHSFGALDEYSGAGVPCNAASGYLMIANQNSQQGCASNMDSIMRGGVTPFVNNLVDPYASGMLGHRVSNPEGLPDPVNTKAQVTLNPITSPTSNPSPVISGTATDQPFMPPSGTAMTINYIKSVQYRIDGGAWQNATPSDGSFNQVGEAFSFTPTLTLGTHLIEVQAINRVNHASAIASASISVASPTATPTQTLPPVPTATRTQTLTPLPTATRTATLTPTATRTATPVPTATRTATLGPTATATFTLQPSPTKTPKRGNATPTSSGSTTLNPPTSLTAKASTGYVTVTWKASPTTGVTYNVYRGTSSSTLILVKSGLTALSYKDATVTKGTTYYYYATASKNGVESSPTGKVAITAR